MAPSSHREIVVIDASLPDWAMLRDGISPGHEVVLIDAGADGLDQLVRALHGRTGIDAVHIMSHGFPGGLLLGTARLDQDSLAARRPAWAAIAACLSDDARIALYGCRTASGDGAAFLSGLAAATGADIAASSTLTGAARLGGDWNLDWRSGDFAVAAPLAAAAMQAYAHVMIPSAPAYSSAAGYVSEQFFEITFDQALDAANPPGTSAFSVQINGTGVPVSGVTVTGNVVRLSYTANPLTPGDIIDFSYQDPTGGDDANAVQNGNGRMPPASPPAPSSSAPARATPPA